MKKILSKATPPAPQIQPLKSSTCPTLSRKSNITYELGQDATKAIADCSLTLYLKGRLVMGGLLSLIAITLVHDICRFHVRNLPDQALTGQYLQV